MLYVDAYICTYVHIFHVLMYVGTCIYVCVQVYVQLLYIQDCRHDLERGFHFDNQSFVESDEMCPRPSTTP